MRVPGLTDEEVQRFRTQVLPYVRSGRFGMREWEEVRDLLRKVDQQTLDDFGIPKWVRFPYALTIEKGFPAAWHWPTWSWKDMCLLFGWMRRTEAPNVIWLRLIALKLRRPGFGFHSVDYFTHLDELDQWLKEGGEA